MTTIETKVWTSADNDSGEIRLIVETLGQKYATEVMQTRDRATRQALITLGWTPPELKKFVFDVWECRDAVEDDVKVGTYELLAESHEIAYRIVGHMEQVDKGRYYIHDKTEEI